jgi:hypothetical protein
MPTGQLHHSQVATQSSKPAFVAQQSPSQLRLTLYKPSLDIAHKDIQEKITESGFGVQLDFLQAPPEAEAIEAKVEGSGLQPEDEEEEEEEEEGEGEEEGSPTHSMTEKPQKGYQGIMSTIKGSLRRYAHLRDTFTLCTNPHFQRKPKLE